MRAPTSHATLRTAYTLALLVVVAAATAGCSGFRWLPQKQGPAFAALTGSVTTEARDVSVTTDATAASPTGTHRIVVVGVVVGVTVPGQKETQIYCAPALVTTCTDLKVGQHLEIQGDNTAGGFIVANKIKERP